MGFMAQVLIQITRRGEEKTVGTVASRAGVRRRRCPQEHTTHDRVEDICSVREVDLTGLFQSIEELKVVKSDADKEIATIDGEELPVVAAVFRRKRTCARCQ